MSQEILLEARELIKHKRIDEARKLLRTIPLDSTAQKWLAKLDEVAPEKSLTERVGEIEPLRKPKPIADVIYIEDTNRWEMFRQIGAYLSFLLAGFVLGLLVSNLELSVGDVSIGGCDSQMKNWWDDEAEAVIVEFLDTAETAGATSRGSLSPIVLELRGIQRDFERLDYPDCGQTERDLLNDGISFGVDGYNSFLGNQEFLADVQFEDATEKLTEAYDLLFDRGVFADIRLSNPDAYIW